MGKKHYDLDNDEKEILKDFEEGNFVSVDNLNEERDFAKRAADNFMKRDNRINIQISAADLKALRYGTCDQPPLPLVLKANQAASSSSWLTSASSSVISLFI